MYTLNAYMCSSCGEVIIEVESVNSHLFQLVESGLLRRWNLTHYLCTRDLARTCKVDPMMNAHFDWDTFSITHWGEPWGGTLCKKQAMVYKPRLQLTCFTRRFGLGHKDGILIFFAQYLWNTSLSKRVFLDELEEALAHEITQNNLAQDVQHL